MPLFASPSVQITIFDQGPPFAAITYAAIKPGPSAVLPCDYKFLSWCSIYLYDYLIVLFILIFDFTYLIIF